MAFLRVGLALQSIEEMAELEAFGEVIDMTSLDHRGGLAAFAEKRAAVFVGC
jgi:hypothetical protein